MSITLNNAQKRYLKGLAHTLKPVVMIGGKGITPTIVAETQLALDTHELIKVKIAAEDRETRDGWLSDLIDQSQATLVTRIGNIAVLYQRHPKKPLIVIPKN